MYNRPVLLMILDGFGINNNSSGNAVLNANIKNYKDYLAKYPNSIIRTSGHDVGLPKGQMGNSEVGHMNIGAGRIVYQELTRISKSIDDGEFFSNESFINAINNAKKHGSNLHIFGLLSDGGVHSHVEHLYSLLELAKRYDFTNVYVHCFMDGRDVSPTSGVKFVNELENKMNEIGIGQIASVMGRYYAMDRDNRWDRVELAYNAMVLANGETSTSAKLAVEKSYSDGITDEFIKPTVILRDKKPVATIKENDSVIFYNFRADRAREITRSFVDESFDGFNRAFGRFPLYYVCMTEYDKSINNVNIAFKPQTLDNTFGEYISKLGYNQLRIAETEKYAHVTFFFNGGVEDIYKGESRELVPSPKVATYDMKPEMSAYEVTDKVIDDIKSNKYNFILLNYANCDMVGHTGDFDATVKAVTVVDECLGRVVNAIKDQNGVVLITSDHGNAEQMIDYETGDPLTSHTTNVVPLIIIGLDDVSLKEGRLCDITPTILDIMGEDIPSEMSGVSLIK